MPEEILGEFQSRFEGLAPGATVCIKICAADGVPYPFAVSAPFVCRVVQEIGRANPGLRIVLIDGGAGKNSAAQSAESGGLTQIPGTDFVDADEADALFVPNPNPEPFRLDGFWLPRVWVEADLRVSLATCRLGSHHGHHWYCGTIHNLLGLLPRSKHPFAEGRNELRSLERQQELDGPAADLYATMGRNVLAVLDGRIVARQDEHRPLRFTQPLGVVIVSGDPYTTDEAAVEALELPFLPPYVAMIQSAVIIEEDGPVAVRRTSG